MATAPLLLQKTVQDKIRTAWQKRKLKSRATVKLDGELFIITLMEREVTFTVNKQQNKQVESWLVVRPAKGIVPVGSIELTPGCNTRSRL